MEIMDSDVAYSPTKSSSISHVRGTERLASGGTGFTWRGYGWLAFVTSRWWVRGWGEKDGVEWMFICALSCAELRFTWITWWRATMADSRLRQDAVHATGDGRAPPPIAVATRI